MREVKEESGIELDPKDISAAGPVKNVTKPDGSKLQVQGFVAHVKKRPPTSMTDDPDAEVHRWQWVDVSKGLPDDIKKNLHVPLEDNALRNELGHPSEDGDSMSLKKYMAKHGDKIKKDEAEDIGAEKHQAAPDELKDEEREKPSHKGKMNPAHAKILGMEDEEDYC